MKKFISIVLVCVIFLGFSANANTSVRLTGINDKVLDYQYGTEPVMFSGRICVPYTIFSRDLGISTIYSADRQILTLYNTNHIITIDITTGTIRDENLNIYTGPVFYRGSEIYIPAQIICGIFGLEYSVITSLTETIRISSSSANLSNEVFKTLADIAYKSLTSSETPTVTVPQATPEQEVIKIQNIKPVFIETLTKQQVDMFDEDKITYYVSENSFLDSEIIRYAYIKNHAIGIYVPVQTENVDEYINEINEKIFQTLGIKTRLVYIENSEEVEKIEESSYKNLDLDYRSYTLNDLTKSTKTSVSVNLTKATNIEGLINFCNTNKISVLKIDEFNN
ncbi:MAG: hypothetical protein R3Y12_08085 [Clostridia bacterium]